MRRNTLLAAALALAAAVTLAPTAAADEPSTTVVAYAATFGGIVCDVLDDYPTTFSGVLGIAQAIQSDGLTAYQAGQVIGLSVAEICPRHLRLMQRFIDIYGGSQVA